MRRAWVLGFSTLALAASLLAQARPGGGSAQQSAPDARIGAGGIRGGTPNILYPGSPRGGQPGSILTPGTPRSPGASNLPGTPGASIYEGSNRSVRQPNRQFRPGRGFGRPGGSFGRGFLFGGGFGVDRDFDYDPGDFEDEREYEREEARREAKDTSSRDSYTVNFPGSRSQQSPRPRVYDVSETPDGRVEMTPIDPGKSPAAAPVTASDYWLIALKGGLIYAAGSYEERDETFRFKTVDNKQFVVPLAEVDLTFTAKLNSDLGREFILH